MKNKSVLRFIIPPAIIVSFIIILIVGLSTKNSSHSEQSGWMLQTNLSTYLNGRTINDMTFIDSVTGFAVTNALSQTDTCFIFKTTNGGDNWFVNYWTNEQFANAFRRIKFVSKNIGYVCGGGGYALVCKTTDGGNNWIKLNFPSVLSFLEMSTLNQDTLYVINDNGMTGGIFISTNGGSNFSKIYSGAPENIYMYNAKIGYYSNYYGLYKSTNSGYNWTLVNNKGFSDIRFIDTLIGYRVSPDSNGFGRVQKTTNGGFNWLIQQIPNVPGVSTYKSIEKFYFNGIDTIWGVGSFIEYINPLRDFGLIYITTNGGINWGYQIPDTHNIKIYRYSLISFINNKFGWIYNSYYNPGKGIGIHTTTGGDSTIYTSINNNTASYPNECILFQNYPNPFNPVTNIKYQIANIKYIILKIYDINGKEITTLINKEQSAGTYEVTYDGSNLSSGVYFYSLFVDGVRIDTKKFMLIK